MVPQLKRFPGFWAGLAMLVAGILLFTFFGNAVRGYIDTSSLFYWWGHLWFTGDGDTEHGPIILGVALLILVRNILGMKSTEGRILPPHGVPVIVAAALVYLGFYLVDSEWWRIRYGTGDFFSFGVGVYLLLGVILAALYTFFRNWSQFPKEGAEPAPRWALAMFLIGLGLHWVGFMGQQTRISIVGALFFGFGVAFLMGGRRWAGGFFFPTVLLLMAMPLGFLTDELGFKMRMWVISATTGFAQLVGVDVIRNGTQLLAPDGSYSYDVAPACSGIRSLMALTALSLVIGYLSFQTTWRRLTLLALALPFAFVGNVMRITAIVFAGHWFGQEAGTQVHDSGGFLIFLVVLGLSLGTVVLIHKTLPEKGARSADMEDEEPDGDRPPAPIGVPAGEGGLPETPERTRPVLVTSCVSLGAAVLIALGVLWVNTKSVSNQTGLHLARDRINPVELPSFLGIDWIGYPQEVSEIELETLPDDTGYSRKNYVHQDDVILLAPGMPQRSSVYLSIVLSGMDRTSIHRPEICLVGQGYTITGKFQHEFVIPGLEGNLPVTVLQIEQALADRETKKPLLDENGDEIVVNGLYAYWFVGGDVMVPTHWERMARMAKDRVLHLKSHRWAYITAQTMVPDGKEAGLARIQEVLSETLEEFQAVGFSRGELDDAVASVDP